MRKYFLYETIPLKSIENIFIYFTLKKLSINKGNIT